MKMANPEALTREQLYEMIWKEPTRTVAARLRISDVGLAKVCRKYHIPRPWRGYWQKSEAGKPPRTPKLLPWPTHLGKEPTAITFHATPPAVPEAPTPPRPPEPETVQAQGAYEADPAHQITVAETLTEPERMVRRALRLLRKKDDRGYHYTREHPCLAIHVTTGSLDRALRIFDALLKGCRARGWTVESQADSPWHTRVTVLGEVIPIGIDEKVRTIRAPQEPMETRDWLKPRPKDTYEPTGRLTLWLGADRPYYGHERTWSDGKRQRVETCLKDVMIGVVEVLEGRKAARREAAERQRRLAEEERRRQEAAERWEREKDRREELQRQAQTWSRTHELRMYLTALRSAAQTQLQEEPDGRLARWVRWAEAYVDGIDPMQAVASLPLNPAGYGRQPIDLGGFGVDPTPDSSGCAPDA
jgi:hypothetical protein